ncbi:MAG: SAM-dependent methyltransferase [Flammeovirgaceae bacterium]|nr:MAG: SAM-dependent methyltransferase [Flammeovirgaceae bacterium]
MTKPGTLFLIPNVIAEGTADEVILPGVKQVIKGIQYFLAEDIRTARRFVSSLKVFDSVEALQFSVLNKDTDAAELNNLLKPLINGNDMGIITESGCPGVADPGALAVAFAQQKNIRVVPLVGPSSLLLALMGSGLNGQQFSFHGYLPVQRADREKAIADYEKDSRKKGVTQIFIETPYRNNQVFESFLHTLAGDTLLCVAVDITGPAESIKTRKVSEWKKHKTEWPKLPAVFLFLAR